MTRWFSSLSVVVATWMVLSSCSDDTQYNDVTTADVGESNTSSGTGGGGEDAGADTRSMADGGGDGEDTGRDSAGLDDTSALEDTSTTEDTAPPEDTEPPEDTTPPPRMCMENVDCLGGELCEDGRCVEVCSDDDPCSGALDVCSPAGFCVDCVGDDDCSEGQRCRAQVCAEACTDDTECSPSEFCEADDAVCVERVCEEDSDCMGGFRCVRFQCISIEAMICMPSRARCTEQGERALCNATGTEEATEACPEDTRCVEQDAGEARCAPVICEPNAIGCRDTATAVVCDGTGTLEMELPCRNDQYCADGACLEQVCMPETTVCEGDEVLIRCDALGAEAERITCGELAACEMNMFGCVCSDGACRERACEPGEGRCVGNAAQMCTADGLAFEPPMDCGDEGRCVRGICRPAACEPGQRLCEGERALVCNADGTGFDETDCQANDQICVEDPVRCEARVCTPNTTGCLSPQQAFACDERGATQTVVVCEEGTSCVDGMCEEVVCVAGERSCQDSTQALRCNDEGSGLELAEVCAPGTVCDEGTCVLTCEPGPSRESSYGCGFWAADLAAEFNASMQPQALLVFNPDPAVTATVQVTDPTGMSLPSLRVAPGRVGQVVLDAGRFDLDTSLLGPGAWEVRSSSPVGVMQVPENPTELFTGDTSLLWPEASAGQSYIAVSWRHRQDIDVDLQGFVTVISPEDRVRVTVTPTVDLAPGPGLPQGLTAGEPWTGTLGRGVVLNLLSVNGGDDLTGTRIESSSPVVAFSGHACANVPSGVEACDQLQEQLLPIERWGTRYVAVPFAARGDMPDTWMVIGGADGVQVTATIPIEGLGAGELLQTGQQVVFESDEPFELRADGPVLLVQLAHGAQGEGSIPDPRCGDFFDSGLGDPSMALVPAVASWRRSVMFTTPPGIADDHILLTAPEGTTVALDGTPLTDWRPLGGTGLSWLRTPVSDGVHRLEGTRPFGLITYGFDCFISYATVGGLNPSATQVPRGNCDLCQADSDCGPGGRCTAPADDGPTVCALACTTAAECGADYTCAMRDGAQVCISTTTCQGTLEPFCQDPPSCSGDTPYLDPGACACVGCLSDEDCGPNAFCNVQQACEENSNTGGCQSDSDCVMGDTVGRCDATLGCYTPGQCGDQDPFDSSCPEGLICEAGIIPLFQACAGCIDNNDCRAGEFCTPDPFGSGANSCFVFPN